MIRKEKESKGKGQRRRESRHWKPLRYTYPKAGTEIPIASTAQEKPKDKQRFFVHGDKKWKFLLMSNMRTAKCFQDDF